MYTNKAAPTSAPCFAEQGQGLGVANPGTGVAAASDLNTGSPTNSEQVQKRDVAPCFHAIVLWFVYFRRLFLYFRNSM